MSHPFRFGVQLTKLPAEGWREQVRHIESLGFSTVFFPDHFHDQLDPTAALAAIGAVTTRLRVGALVYDVDYRHPVVFAKQAATIQLLTGGRHEFGIGAGWMETDYVEAGLSYDRPGVRIERLEEALQIIRGMWTQEKTSFEGRHYQVREIARAAAGLEPADAPKILIGGGGRRVLSLAGRFADIVGINPKMKHGEILPETPADLAPDKVREKVGWVREAAAAAGRDPATLEFNSLAFLVAIADDVSGIRELVGKRAGMTADEVADCPIFLTGSAQEIRERLEKRREETGISYVVVSQQDARGIEAFAEAVVQPLSGK